MLKGTNHLMLNHATVAAVITEWLKSSWPTEVNVLSVTEIVFDGATNSYKVSLAAPLPPVEPAPPVLPPA